MQKYLKYSKFLFKNIPTLPGSNTFLFSVNYIAEYVEKHFKVHILFVGDGVIRYVFYNFFRFEYFTLFVWNYD